MRAAALAGVALVLVACGGKVVFEEDGGDGGGSSSSSPSGAAGPGTFEPGPEPDPRGDLCKAACEPSGCASTPGCVEECLTAFGAGCDAAAGDYLQCIADGFITPDCVSSVTCEAEVDAWAACPKNLCSDGCSHADQDCSCLRTCDAVELQMTCSLVADAEASCECKVDGAVVSSCTETHLACDLDFGCCAGAFGF